MNGRAGGSLTARGASVRRAALVLAPPVKYPRRWNVIIDVDGAFGTNLTMAERDQRVAQAIDSHRDRLQRFVRRRLRDPRDVQDVLQDVFEQLVEANRLLMPIEHVAAWLFTAARNRITDLLRKHAPASFSDLADDEERLLDSLASSLDAGPDASYARDALIEALRVALEALPAEQRAVFVAHELEGRSFKQMADESGVPINTLLSRKRYAVLQLRERLRDVADLFDDDPTRSST
jgi:RNA polymerase sigma factor (sigma-70 family)